MKYIPAVVTSALLLGACATTDDPREGGFIGGVQGLSSGAYDRRIQEREESLRRLNEIKRELGSEQERLSSERQRSQARLAELQRQLSRLDQEVARLTRRLEREQQQLAGDREKTAGLKRDLGQLRQQIARAGDGPGGDRTVEELEAERDRLEEEYRQLLDLYLELGR